MMHARALAREILMMGAAEYAAAFKGSAIKRAKLSNPPSRHWPSRH
jgi:hypothetical protein